MLGVEAFQAGVEILLQRRGYGNCQRAPLTDIAHIHEPPELHAVPFDPLNGEAIPRFTFQPSKLGFQRGAAGAVRRRQVGAEEIVSHVEEEAA